MSGLGWRGRARGRNAHRAPGGASLSDFRLRPKKLKRQGVSASLYPAPGAHSRALAGSVVRVRLGLAIFCVKDELVRPTLASA